MHFANGVRKTSTAPARSPVGFAAIILAAGNSLKKGRPMQLCPYLGRTLVEHVTRTALASGACEVLVVAGEHAEEIRRQLRRLPVRVIQNRGWQEGIASSIRTGISHLRSGPGAAIVCLCDQPRITPDHLQALGQQALARNGPQIVASSYDGISGAPASFARSVFPDLLALKGNAGARQLIRNAGSRVQTIRFADANEEVEFANGGERPQRPRRQGFFTKPLYDFQAARAPPPTQIHPSESVAFGVAGRSLTEPLQGSHYGRSADQGSARAQPFAER